MRYTLFHLDRPYGDPSGTILETDNRTEVVQKVAEIIRSGEPPELYRMVEDKSIPEPEPVILEGVFD